MKEERLRFIAPNRELSITNGLCFVVLVMSWLREWGIKEEAFWQGYYKPYGAILGRAHK